MKLFRSARFFLFAFLLSVIPATSFAGVFISVNFAPPPLLEYEQPQCPEEGFLWTPGYWAYGDDGYYWVPGAWVPAPQRGYLWTPAYWGYEGGQYRFFDGYWGPHVGYYGGVNYGFGYMGIGFSGGEWRGDRFAYNTAIVNVNRTVIHNTYINETIVHNTTIINNNHVAYAGGPNGIRHEPTSEERRGMTEHHIAPTPVQRQHFEAAAKDPQQHFNVNHGHPATIASPRPITVPQHGQQMQNGRPGAQGGQMPVHENRPGQVNQPGARPENRPMPNTPNARPEPRPMPNQPNVRPEPRPMPNQRPEPQVRPEPRPMPRPEPQARPEPRPMPQSRPEPRPAPAERPAPQPRPEPHPTNEKPQHPPQGHGR